MFRQQDMIKTEKQFTLQLRLPPKAQIQMSLKKSSCDVNADGVVDLLDITYCQKQFYRMGEKSIDWNDFKHCDLDGNGLIDIEDLIIILKVM